MKKIILVLMCIIITLAISACGNDTAEPKNSEIQVITKKTTGEKTSLQDNNDPSEDATPQNSEEAGTEQPTESQTPSVTETPTENSTEQPQETSTPPVTEIPTENSTEQPNETPTEGSTEEPVVRPTDGPEISADNYNELHEKSTYSSYEEFRDSLINYDKNKLEQINAVEAKYLYNTIKSSYVSDDEIKNGIFGNFRKNIIETDSILVPFISNKMSFTDYSYDQKITVYSSYETLRKPTIKFATENFTPIHTTYVDKALVDEANEKGASWLSSILDPNSINVENQRQFLSTEDLKYISVYEKECSLADRTVIAMFVENHEIEDDPRLHVYFLYDDVYVYVWGKKSSVEETLSKLSFYECEFSTGKPLRDTSGRTEEYLAEK